MNELLRDLHVKDLRWEQWGVKAQVQVGLGCDSTLQMFYWIILLFEHLKLKKIKSWQIKFVL